MQYNSNSVSIVNNYDNFDGNILNILNKLVNIQLYVSNCYLQLFCYFDNQSVSLSNISKYFKNQSNEYVNNNYKLISYINKRGGQVIIESVHKPQINNFNLLKIFEYSLYMEKEINKLLLNILKSAGQYNDIDLFNLLSSFYLKEQIERIDRLKRYITEINLCCSNNEKLGSYIFNKNFNKN